MDVRETLENLYLCKSDEEKRNIFAIVEKASDDELALWIKETDPVIIWDVSYQAQKVGNLKLALKMENIVDVILQEKLENLKEAYYSGNLEEFLQKLSFTEKSELSMKMLLIPKQDIILLKVLSESLDSKFLKELVERQLLLYTEV